MAISCMRHVACEKDDMRVWRANHIAANHDGRDDYSIPTDGSRCRHVRNVLDDEVRPRDPDGVAFVPQRAKVVITID